MVRVLLSVFECRQYPDLSLIIWYPAHLCILFDVCVQHCVMLAQLMILYCAVSLTRSTSRTWFDEAK